MKTHGIRTMIGGKKKKWNTKSDTKYFYSISNNINQQFYNALNIFDYKFTIKRNNLK